MLPIPSRPEPSRARDEPSGLEGWLSALPEVGLSTMPELGRRAAKLAALSARSGKPFSCVVFAPDPVEGSHPGDAGRLPSSFVYALRTSTREADAIGRIEPGVFALLAPETSPERIPVFAHRLQREVALAPWDPSVFIGPMIRMGYAGVEDPTATPRTGLELLVRANEAFRRAAGDPSGPWLRKAS